MSVLPALTAVVFEMLALPSILDSSAMEGDESLEPG